ncbi:MAG: hypothetical protein IPG82_04740 [Saprospiraceae bacterium]|nr:hypothetical protein [Saprospiraceae bacterium]
MQTTKLKKLGNYNNGIVATRRINLSAPVETIWVRLNRYIPTDSQSSLSTIFEDQDIPYVATNEVLLTTVPY